MKALSVALKVSGLSLILFVCFTVAGLVVGPLASSQTSEPGGSTALALLAVCFLNTIVFTHIILRSRWSGWRLMVAVFFVFYGVMTVMSQMETAVFVTQLPEGVLPRLFLMGALIAAPFAVLAVLMLGKRRADVVSPEPNLRLVMPAREWGWKLALIAVTYLVLYFSFGYFIAWQNPAVREYYGGSDEGSFLAQMGTELDRRPWLIPFQVLRVLLWVALALPVIRMMKGSWWEISHLIETASSNFIFGFFIGWFLTQRHTSIRSRLAPSGQAAITSPTRPDREANGRAIAARWRLLGNAVGY
jgi:hypothetical protein